MMPMSTNHETSLNILWLMFPKFSVVEMNCRTQDHDLFLNFLLINIVRTTNSVNKFLQDSIQSAFLQFEKDSESLLKYLIDLSLEMIEATNSFTFEFPERVASISVWILIFLTQFAILLSKKLVERILNLQHFRISANFKNVVKDINIKCIC